MGLVAVRCTSCGGEIQLDSQKESGFCLYCGSRVLYEEAIRIVENVNGPKVVNIFKIAMTAYEDSNYSDAVQYFNRVLEIDSQNWAAIFYKGLSRAWMSTLTKICLNEAVSASERALEIFTKMPNVSISQIHTMRNNFSVEIDKVITAVKNFSVSHYNQFRSVEGSAAEHCERIIACCSCSGYCSNLITDDMAKTNSTFRNNKLRYLKDQVEFMIARCIIRSSNDSVAHYDECVAEIKRFDPSYTPREIIRANSYCYIATAVYGSYDAPEVLTLRKYRDDVLCKSLAGQLFIKAYYKFSPTIAFRLKNENRLNMIAKYILDHMVAKLRKTNLLSEKHE